ncbi:hypothetical protein V493_01770 [Pseudogymnoascus sp. VKM F-4281 (FW-2241)]|nr:hypothetical protein V493_01770 [Pseudogymnoascus sp. VKM F-4281 (FW-2241)]
MVPKDQPRSHAVILTLKLMTGLPKDNPYHIPTRSLGEFKGFVRTGALQTKASPGDGACTKPQRVIRADPRRNGETLYDSSGSLIEIDGFVLRGAKDTDQSQNRVPGIVNVFTRMRLAPLMNHSRSSRTTSQSLKIFNTGKPIRENENNETHRTDARRVGAAGVTCSQEEAPRVNI